LLKGNVNDGNKKETLLTAQPLSCKFAIIIFSVSFINAAANKKNEQ